MLCCKALPLSLKQRGILQEWVYNWSQNIHYERVFVHIIDGGGKRSVLLESRWHYLVTEHCLYR